MCDVQGKLAVGRNVGADVPEPGSSVIVSASSSSVSEELFIDHSFDGIVTAGATTSDSRDDSRCRCKQIRRATT